MALCTRDGSLYVLSFVVDSTNCVKSLELKKTFGNFCCEFPFFVGIFQEIFLVEWRRNFVVLDFCFSFCSVDLFFCIANFLQNFLLELLNVCLNFFSHYYSVFIFIL